MAEGTEMSRICEGRGKAGGTRKRLIEDRAVIPAGNSRFILTYRVRERELAGYYTIAATKSASISSRPRETRMETVHREPGWCASSRTLERCREQDKESEREQESEVERRGLIGLLEGIREREREKTIKRAGERERQGDKGD